MKIERRYTKAGESPFANIPFRTTKSEIRNPDGSVVCSASTAYRGAGGSGAKSPLTCWRRNISARPAFPPG